MTAKLQNSMTLKDKDLHENDHIMTILDIDCQQNTIYIFMEFCDLGDLNHFFAKYCEQLDVQDKVRLMRQIIDGIAFLHDRNIVHRDIKPANILLTSKSEICGCQSVVVKISDFDLIKILDPDSVTSAMSSNVGSLAFKAPEFFSNNKVKYRKNVDVYAAGLTFAAMLQAQPGTNLMPKVEGVACSIGLAAHNRMVTGQSDIVVVEDKDSDSVLVKKIKDIIRGMTDISTTHRLSASTVNEKFDDPLMECRAKSPLDLFQEPVCLINSGIVGISCDSKDMTLITQSSNQPFPNGSVHASSCNHYLPYGLFAECRMARAPDTTFIFEGCPHPSCKVIRIFDLKTRTRFVVFKNVEPHKICPGPWEALLVCDWAAKSVLHLVPEGREYICIHQLELDFLPVQGMCYSNHCNALVFSKADDHKVFAINLSTGQKLWQINQSDGTVDDRELRLEDICSITDRWICIANKTSLMFLRPCSGNLVTVLHIKNITERDKPVSQSQTQNMLGLSTDIEQTNGPSSTRAITGTQLSLLTKMDGQSPQKNLIIYARGPGSLLEPVCTEAISDISITSQGFHQVMCCDGDMGPVLAVRYEEYAYNVTSIPGGRFVA